MEFRVEIPLVTLLGIELVSFSGGASELVWSPKPEHLNSFGVLHGGAIMTMLDVGLAHAARSTDADTGIVTIEMKTSFMQAANGPLVGKGVMLHRTGTMAFTEGRIYDAQGRLCVHATGTFKYMKRKPKVDSDVNGELRSLATD